VMLLHKLHHSPIWSSPLVIACLKALRGMSMTFQSPVERETLSTFGRACPGHPRLA
jgi:hypothetical protein